jgi:hypothetical protein
VMILPKCKRHGRRRRVKAALTPYAAAMLIHRQPIWTAYQPLSAGNHQGYSNDGN